MHHSFMGKKMKKKIRLSTKNRPGWAGEPGVKHVLPNKFVQRLALLFLERSPVSQNINIKWCLPIALPDAL